MLYLAGNRRPSLIFCSFVFLYVLLDFWPPTVSVCVHDPFPALDDSATTSTAQNKIHCGMKRNDVNKNLGEEDKNTSVDFSKVSGLSEIKTSSISSADMYKKENENNMEKKQEEGNESKKDAQVKGRGNENDEWPHRKATGHVLKYMHDDRVYEQNYRLKKPFFFIAVTDPQLGMMHNTHWEEETERFKKVVDHINRLQPAFVVNMGDIAQEWPVKSQPLRSAQLQTAVDVMKGMNKTIPLLLTCGNHDVENRPTEETIGAFERKFGETYFLFVHEGVACLMLNSALLYDPSGVPNLAEEQLKWFEETLEDLSKKGVKHILLFQHHPFFNFSFDEDENVGTVFIKPLDREVNRTHFQIKKERRMPILRLLNKYGIKYVFHGHTHWNSVVTSGGITQIGTTAIGMQLGDDVSGLRVIKVYEDRLKHQYYPSDEVPDKIEMN